VNGDTILFVDTKESTRLRLSYNKKELTMSGNALQSVLTTFKRAPAFLKKPTNQQLVLTSDCGVV
jgi:hypothetical protein